jgi:site-specific DNA-methyltransferase (adenine-specific)
MKLNKIYHGDCIELMDHIDTGSIDAIITDPPYGTTACKWDSVIPFEPMWNQLKRIIKPNGAIVLFGSQPFTSALIMSNIKQFKYCWIWDKVNSIRNHLNAKKQPMRVKEDIIVFYKKQCTYNPQMRKGSYISRKTTSGQSETFGKVTGIDRNRKIISLYPLDIIKIKGHDPNNVIHPTQKPVALMEYLIKTYTDPLDTVLDFTCGSGTTCLAASNLDRFYMGIDSEKKYVNIARKRLKDVDANCTSDIESLPRRSKNRKSFLPAFNGFC